MREGINVEGKANVFLGGIEDVLTAGDAGVVDEDGWGAGCGANGGGDRGDLGGGGDVALVVSYQARFRMLAMIHPF